MLCLQEVGGVLSDGNPVFGLISRIVMRKTRIRCDKMAGMRFKEIRRFEARVRKAGGCGCWVWTGALNNGGYGRFVIGGREELAHRAAWMLYKGEIPDGLLVLHRCDNPGCVRSDHLFLGTHADNAMDKMLKGRGGTTKLSDEQVREIRAVRAEGVKVRVIAEQFGVVTSTVSDIDRYKRRASVR